MMTQREALADLAGKLRSLADQFDRHGALPPVRAVEWNHARVMQSGGTPASMRFTFDIDFIHDPNRDG